MKKIYGVGVGIGVVSVGVISVGGEKKYKLTFHYWIKLPSTFRYSTGDSSCSKSGCFFDEPWNSCSVDESMGIWSWKSSNVVESSHAEIYCSCYLGREIKFRETFIEHTRFIGTLSSWYVVECSQTTNCKVCCVDSEKWNICTFWTRKQKQK